MLPCDFPEANATYTKPPGTTDEQVMAVPAYRDIDVDGLRFVMTAWMPNKEDLEALNAGRPLYLKICGGGMPPVAMFTVDAEGFGNF